jgi:hypothetical protein
LTFTIADNLHLLPLLIALKSVVTAASSVLSFSY